MTKVARIQAENGAKARAQAPHIGLDPPVWRSSAQYYAFLSYSHKDEELADWLHSELERFQVPRALAGKLTANGVIPKRLTPIFRDRHELAAATDLGEEIKAALAASQYLLVLCSPDAAKSHWTNAEIETFKRTRPDGCVLAAIVAGDPFASDIKGHEGEECFPPALRQKFDRRGRPTGKRAEPLAADLRDTGDGRRMGFLKLVAGMLGVGLDELVQRDATRRQRRLAWLSAASLTGMVVASFLAITAIQARDAARDQRRQAEGLVAFMLGDLKDKLEPIGKLDALDGVGARVLAYYSKQDASELADNGLLQRSRALSLTAQVAYSRGNLDTAEKLYREAMAGTAEAIRRKPDDPQRIYDHAQNVFWAGDIARVAGKPARAEAAMRDYKRLATEMVRLQPDNLKYRMELQNAESNLGVVLLQQRRFRDAAEQFANALRNIQAMTIADASNSNYQKSLVEAQAWFAEVLAANGQLEAAIVQVNSQIDLLHRLYAQSGDMEYLQRLVPAQRTIGELYLARGQTEEAAEHTRAAIIDAQKLLVREPANSRWRYYGARAQLNLGQILIKSRNPVEAEAATKNACGTLQDLLRGDPGDQRWRSSMAQCWILRARIAAARSDLQSARTLAQRALDSARAVQSADTVADRHLVAKAYRLIGDVDLRLGRQDEARSAWQRALSVLPPNAAEKPDEMAEHAMLLRRLGRGAESRPFDARLAAMSYRDPEYVSM